MRKGFIRTVEAMIATFMVLTFIIFVVPAMTPRERGGVVLTTRESVQGALENLDKSGELATLTMSDDMSGIKEKVSQYIGAVNFTVGLCRPATAEYIYKDTDKTLQFTTAGTKSTHIKLPLSAQLKKVLIDMSSNATIALTGRIEQRTFSDGFESDIFAEKINTTVDSGYVRLSESRNISWSSKEAMPTARSGAASAMVNGKIYVIGGADEMWNVLDAVEEYNPLTNTWSTKTDMPTARTWAAAAVVGGKIYVLGGYNSSWTTSYTIEVYDPSTNTWSAKSAMPTPRGFATASTANNKIYLIGGYYDGGPPSNTIEEYNPTTDTWETNRAPMPRRKAILDSASLDNKIYVVGGYDNGASFATLDVYNPLTNTWSAKTDMPTPRYGLAAVAAFGKIYAIGGACSPNVDAGCPNQGVPVSTLSTIEAYDPSTNTWSTKTDMANARDFLTAEAIINKIYVIGGYVENSGLPSSATEEGVIQYLDSGYAVSNAITTPSPILSAAATWSEILPAGTAVSAQVSVNNGQTWYDMQKGVVIDTSADNGSILRYKVNLNTANPIASPLLDSISINYTLAIGPGTQEFPANVSIDIGADGTIDWNYASTFQNPENNIDFTNAASTWLGANTQCDGYTTYGVANDNYCEVPVLVSTISGGWVYIKNIRVKIATTCPILEPLPKDTRINTISWTVSGKGGVFEPTEVIIYVWE